jgi:hypothetical protein
MRWTAFLIAAIVGIIGLPSSSVAQIAPGPTVRYFEVSDGSPKETFFIALSNPALIEEARAIADGREKLKVHVSGKVVRGAAPYNPPWRFHLDPDSINFFETSIEVCDATTSYVEEHLAEVGDHFLPHGIWCPWGSRVVREVQNPPSH